MTDEHLAAMHKLLAEYHRKLAKAAVLDIVQRYHVDLAQRLADEAAQIPRRTAILLIGGDKTGDDRFCERMVPIADQLYDVYITEIRKEGLIP